jgi:hypothetical protein
MGGPWSGLTDGRGQLSACPLSTVPTDGPSLPSELGGFEPVGCAMNRRTGGIVLGAVGTVLLGLTLLAASPAGAAPQDLSDCLNPGAMVDCATTVGGTAADAAGVGGIQTALGGPEAWLKSLVESAGQGVELAFGMVQSYLSSSAEPELVAPMVH